MIPEQKIIIKWSKSNKKRFVELGYIFTIFGDIFEVSISDIPLKSNYLVKFICDFCLGENQLHTNDKMRSYKDLLSQREKTGKDSCGHDICRNSKRNLSYSNKKQYIRNKTTNKKTREISDDLNAEWSDKNKKNYNEYTIRDKVWWKCINGHEWEATISNRLYHKSGCPYCSNYSRRKITKEVSLLSTQPTLSEEWNFEKNGSLTPDMVTEGSSKKVWWLCKNSHEWCAKIASRVTGRGCPYCSGRYATLQNCLATTNPKLTLEWNTERNKDLTPYEIGKASNKKVWWKCSKCSHEWKSSVNNRTSGTGCPLCSEPKGEKRIRKYFNLNKLIFISQYQFKGLLGLRGNRLKFDFAVLDINKKLKLLIEYDGEFHFEKQFEEDNHEIYVQHDKIKNKYCKDNNIPLLRIPYWEFDNIELILQNELTKYGLLTSD